MRWHRLPRKFMWIADASFLMLGLVLLTAGADLFVRGAERIALGLRVRPAIVGLTVVAAGTSMPELMVSVRGAMGGQTDLAVGNVLGSNIFNLAGILGLAALVSPLRVLSPSVRIEWPMAMAASVLVFALAWDGTIGPFEGAGLVLALIAFTGGLVRQALRRDPLTSEEVTGVIPPLSASGWLTSGLLTVGGLATLLFGAGLFVDGSIRIAQFLGWSERTIAVTVVSIGTSLPELATSVVASAKGRDDIAVTNLLGSNIFNVFGILGCTAILAPLPIDHAFLMRDGLWALGVSALVFPLMRSGMRVTRVEGALLIAAYAAYVVVLLRQPG